MKQLLILVPLVSLCSTGYTQPDSNVAGNPTLKPLHSAVSQLVKRHFPEATSYIFKNKVHFEYSTRTFVTRALVKVPQGQDPPFVEERGPNANGVWCDIRYHEKERPPYARAEGAVAREHFTEHIYYPNGKTRKCHLFVTLRLPNESKNDRFVGELRKLLESFEEHLSASVG